MIFFLFINVKMPTIVGILAFMNRKNVMLNSIHPQTSRISNSEANFTIWPNFEFVSDNFYTNKLDTVKPLCPRQGQLCGFEHPMQVTQRRNVQYSLLSMNFFLNFFLPINVKIPTIFGILTFMSRKNSIPGFSEPANC